MNFSESLQTANKGSRFDGDEIASREEDAMISPSKLQPYCKLTFFNQFSKNTVIPLTEIPHAIHPDLPAAAALAVLVQSWKWYWILDNLA